MQGCSQCPVTPAPRDWKYPASVVNSHQWLTFPTLTQHTLYTVFKNKILIYKMVLGREDVKVARTSEWIANGCLVALWGVGWRILQFQSSVFSGDRPDLSTYAGCFFAFSSNRQPLRSQFLVYTQSEQQQQKVWNNAWLRHPLLAVGKEGIVLPAATLESSLGSSHGGHMGLSREPQPPGAGWVNLLAIHNPI